MNTFVLLVSRESGWSPDVWATGRGDRIKSGQIMVESESGWLSIIRDDDVLADFSEAELAQIGELASEPKTYLVEWKGAVLIQEFLRSIPCNTRAAIDNDHGLLISVHKIAREPPDLWVTASSFPLSRKP